MTENEKYIYNYVRTRVKSGFLSVDDIISETLETIDEEDLANEITEDWVQETAKREFEKRQTDSKNWKTPTDPDRLREVFDHLCREKIVALHNAGYTKEDAMYDVNDVWEDLEDDGIKPIGYCYYHGQDLERVLEDNILPIGFYGKNEKNDKEAIIIGNKVVKAFKDAGFTINWNNTTSKRIEVLDFDWKNVYISEEDIEQKWGYDRVSTLMEEA